jgi:protoporphyrin/coproporphyrin ferrochelatase
MKQGVLLAAHGAPERIQDVPEYLTNVRGGRPVAPAVVEEVLHRYGEIGGASPLLRWTRAQAEALSRTLGLPVFVGMRNWHPYLRDALDEAGAQGIERLAAVCMAPQYSALSVGLYIRAAEQAAGGIRIDWTRSFHDEPLLVQAFAERLAPLAAGRRVIFTAHSLPAKALAPDDPYERECRATAAAVAASLRLPEWDFAFQSQGMTGDDWLGPTVESLLDQAVGEVVVAPVGFVCDHVEVLYDVDVQFRRYGAARGVTVLRPESLNDSPTFTAALAEVARRCLV